MWNIHMIQFSDLIDLWVITVKQPMILCACMRCRSCSQRMWKDCLFCSQNNNIVWLSNIAGSGNEIENLSANFLRRMLDENMHRKKLAMGTRLTNSLINSQGVQRFVGFFSWLCLLGVDWLGRQTLTTWMQFHWRLRLHPISLLCISYQCCSTFIYYKYNILYLYSIALDSFWWFVIFADSTCVDQLLNPVISTWTVELMMKWKRVRNMFVWWV